MQLFWRQSAVRASVSEQSHAFRFQRHSLEIGKFKLSKPLPTLRIQSPLFARVISHRPARSFPPLIFPFPRPCVSQAGRKLTVTALEGSGQVPSLVRFLWFPRWHFQISPNERWLLSLSLPQLTNQGQTGRTAGRWRLVGPPPGPFLACDSDAEN